MKTIFVQVGHPCQKAPASFMFVELNVEEGQEVAQAKLLRKELSGNLANFEMKELHDRFAMRFVPADFYYAIFSNKYDAQPIAASDNYYWRVDKTPREGVENPHAAWWFEQGYADVKNKQDNRPTHPRNLEAYMEGVRAYKALVALASGS